MTVEVSAIDLKLSLLRALLGNIFPDLRQASIEADASCQIVYLRFEFDGEPSAISQEACSFAAAEVIADFDANWKLKEEYLPCPHPTKLNPLAHLVFLRAEIQENA